MPTALRIGGFRFFFWSNERNEPAHIHVESGDGYAKIWLNDATSVAESDGYNAAEVNKIRDMVATNRTKLEEAWDAHRESS